MLKLFPLQCKLKTWSACCRFFFPLYKEATIVVSSGNMLQWEKNMNSLIVFQRPKQPSALEINSPVASKEVGKYQMSAFSFQVSGPKTAPHGRPLSPAPTMGLLLCLLQGALCTQQQQSGAYWFTGVQRVARRALSAVTIPCLLGLVSSAVTPRGNPNFRQQCETVSVTGPDFQKPRHLGGDSRHTTYQQGWVLRLWKQQCIEALMGKKSSLLFSNRHLVLLFICNQHAPHSWGNNSNKLFWILFCK